VPWDTLTPTEQARVADRAVAEQLRERIGPFSPFWRERLRSLGRQPAELDSVAALRRLPAVGERDLCPDSDAVHAARLVLQGDEEGYALHVPGPDLRKALLRRVRRDPGYRVQVEAQMRPTTYSYGGQGLVLPIASTRNDLDVMARAGARLWSVLGLSSADVLVSTVPTAARIEHVGLSYAALGAGAPAFYPGEDLALAEETLRLVPATVLAVAADAATDVLVELGELPATVHTVLLVGAPGPRPVVPGARVLSVWGPAEGRWMYGESEPGSGWLTYPDLEVWDVVDPVTGEQAPAGSGGELVLTQLGVRGSALVRWRTGATVETGLAPGGGGRTVPVIAPTLRTDRLVQWLETAHGPVCLDRRVISAQLAARGLAPEVQVSVDDAGELWATGEAAAELLRGHLGVPVGVTDAT
jgi:hypothetical protein